MSHLLDETYGYTNAMIYVGNTPWHRLGTKIPRGLTVEQAIAACPAVDFVTDTIPLGYFFTDTPEDKSYYDLTLREAYAQGILKDAGNHRAIIRRDTGAVLGMATKRYSPVQIRDQWKGLDPLIEAGLANIETMGSLQGGKRTWAAVQFNVKEIGSDWDRLQEIVGPLAAFGMALDDKTGSRNFVIANTAIQPVCANTVNAALGNASAMVKVRHTGNASAKVQAAAEQLWGEIIESYRALTKVYESFKAYTLTPAEYAALVLDPVAVIPENRDDFSTYARFKGAQRRAQDKRDAVSDLWLNGKGNAGDNSAWDAYSGLTEALDHNAAGAFREPADRLDSMLIGTIGQLKTKVFNNLKQLTVAA